MRQNNRQKILFKSVYCSSYNQRKVCGKLGQSFCCSCAYQIEQERAEEYSDYQQAYQRKEQEQKERFRQYQLLKNYQGCKQCGKKEIDAYSLYEENRLVCQPCRLSKENGASEAISFSEQSKWYKRWWKVNLAE